MRAFGEHRFDGAQDVGGGLWMTEMLEHHRASPDLPDRVGDSPSVDVGCGAVHRFEQRGEFALGIEVGRRGDGNGAGAGGAEVGEDVAEQVGGDDDVEPVGMADEIGGQDVDVELVRPHIRKFIAEGGEAFVPIGHGDRNAIRFGGRGQVFPRALLCERVGEADDAVDADARENAFL